MTFQWKDSVRPVTTPSQMSYEPAIQGLVTLDRLKANLEQSQSQLLWQLHHSPQLSKVGVDLLEKRELKLRSKGVMSPMTVLQNSKLEFQSAMSSPKTTSYLSLPLTPSARSQFRPSARDFKRLMDRLEKLASSKSGANERVQLKENKEFDCILEQGDTQFCFVVVKRKPIPLRLIVKRSRGKLVIFSSKSNPEPSEMMCDEVHRTDKVTVAEPGLRFKVNAVSFCIKALEDVSFSLSLVFGRDHAEDAVLMERRAHRTSSIVSNLEDYRLDEILLMQLSQKVDRIQLHRKTVSASNFPTKDFISINKTILSPQSPERVSMFSQQAKTRSERIQTAQAKKREVCLMKKERTLLVINRRQLKMEEEERTKKVAEINKRRQGCERNWLAFITCAKIGEILCEKLQFRMREIQREELTNRSAALIQAVWRRGVQRVSGPVLIQTQFLNALKLFHRHVGCLFRMQATKSMVQHLRASARNNHVHDAFLSFYRRGNTHTVTLIQSMWKLYQRNEKERWNTLTGMWIKCVESLLAVSNAKFPGKKGAKKRQEAMDRYLGIPISTRNHVLRVYYKAYKLQYREQVRYYITNSYKSSLFKSAKAFQYILALKNHDDKNSLLLAPAFKYKPSEEEMKELIEKTTKM